ncbi:MAG TPA: rod shape-determining protein MreD [Bacteroidales bacterium]|nr:rod shape-determining protein MreD [Bacteroidales bacterium]HNS46758.1 rod shape-determining protein MreD [Bacteroidales bacterium]
MTIRNIIRFVVLVLIQVFILNNINFRGYLDPYLYVLFILLLPFETPGWMLLLSSFLIGFFVDLFSHTLGMNAAASVFMAFMRPTVLRLLSTGRDYDTSLPPGISGQGFQWFLLYSLILIFLHHLVLFQLEAFGFHDFPATLYRILVNTVFTTLLVLLSQFLFMKRK